MRMRAECSGFDGVNSYEAGVADIANEHAKQVFVMGHGIPVDKKDNDLPLDEAFEVMGLSVDQAEAAALVWAEKEMEKTNGND